MSSRLLNFLGNIDRAGAALGGAKWFQTVSGTVGRACGYGFGVKQWWGKPCRWLIDGIPAFGQGHCQRWAENEARMALELGADG